MKQIHSIFTKALLVALLTMTAQTAWATIGGTGTPSDPYTINSADDWNTFASNVSGGNSYQDMYVKLTADINVTQKVGVVSGNAQEKPFSGTFDGNGHTITATITDTENQGTALFCYINGATIKNLSVAGTINGGQYHAAAIVGFSKGTGNSIRNCIATATVDGSSHIGGLLGHGLDSSISIENCLFSGLLTNASSAMGALFGWGNEGGTKTLTNCLYVMADGQNTDNLDLVKKSGGDVTVTNCYKTADVGTIGTAVGSMNATDLATALNNGGEEWQVVGDNVVPIIQQAPNNLKYATITGVISFYSYTGSAITITPTVTAYGGTTLTLGNDFSATLNNENVGSFPFTVTDEGDYTLTITGMGSYSGSQTVTFSVSECPEGLSIDNDFTKGQDGFYYVNMPITGTNTLTFSNSNITTFKVYDDGGKNSNYSIKCNGYLILTAPTGYVLQLSGSINTESTDNLTVYDGSTTSDTKLLDAVYSSTYMVEKSITATSTGNSMMLYFKSDGSDNYRGLDLTMTLVGDDTEYSITVINPETGGSVAASVGGNPATTAKVSNEVTLTATPPSGYMVSDIYVKDENNIPVAVSGGWYSNNQATFIMPGSAVTVTPTFTSAKTAANGLYINMPKTGIKTATIPAGVQSFKVYDDGGDERNYSSNCDGTLVLTAPTGYEVQLSGSITTEKGNDKLTVYNGSTTSDAKLLDGVSSSTDATSTAISTVTSTGHSMRLYFSSDTSYEVGGLNLTVTLIPITYTVSFNANGGEGDAMAAQNYTYDTAQNLTANTYTRTGYTFAGWATTADGEKAYDDQQSVSNLATTQGANVELFAKWKKLLTNGDITIADISSQEYTGSAIEPTVTVSDGSTNITDQCDFTYSDNTNTGTATVTITAKATSTAYSGTTSTTFTITPKPVTVKNSSDEDVPAATGDATITEDENGITLTLITPTGTDVPQTVSIPTAVEVDHVTIQRTYVSGKASTVYLPFSIEVSKLSGGTFHTFTNVDQTTSPWTVNYSVALASTATLEANTPYLFLPDGTNGGKIVVNNGSDKVNVCTANPQTTTQGQWEFIGTYEPIVWAAEHADLGKVYGFAAIDKEVSGKNITAGQFVKAAAGASIAPMRAYLKYTPPSAAPARGMSRVSATDELPATMRVVIAGANGETTEVGTIGIEQYSGEWYTIDGRKLSGAPTKKGLYIHNGRKNVIK